MTEQQTLTEREAFDAMRQFLQAYWDRANSSLVSDVLSDTQPGFFAATVTADPAAWDDWLRCVDRVVAERGSGK